jgi:phage portal protein BeeE
MPNNPRSEAAKRGWETRRRNSEAKITRASTPPVFSYAQNRNQRFGVTDRISPEVLMRAIRGWAAIAVNAIADEGMSLCPYVAVERVRDNGVYQYERLDDHPLARLLKNPSGNFSMRAILRLLFSWIPQVGDSYLLKVTNGLGLPVSLEPLNPKDVEIVPGRYGIDSYLYTSPLTGEQFSYSPQELIRVYTPDPYSPFKGLGKLAPQDLSYDASVFYDQTIRQYFKDDASPKMTIKFPDDYEMMSDEDLTRFNARWKNAYRRRDGENSGVPVLLPPGADLHEFQIWSGKDWVPLSDHYRDKILAAYGVPGSVIGLNKLDSRATVDANRFTFEATTIKPLADLIADSLTNQLARQFDERLVVRFEDFITVDKTFELEKHKAYLDKFVVSVNEVRMTEGLDPVPWGDAPIGQMQDTAITPETLQPEPALQPEPQPPRDMAEENTNNG